MMQRFAMTKTCALWILAIHQMDNAFLRLLIAMTTLIAHLIIA
jgi:hypothetical protein